MPESKSGKVKNKESKSNKKLKKNTKSNALNFVQDDGSLEADTKQTKKMVKVSQSIQIPESDKDQSIDVLYRLRSLESFVDLSEYGKSQAHKIMSLDKMSQGNVSLRTVSDLSPIKKLLFNYAKSFEEIHHETNLIGTFIIFSNSHHAGTRVNVYMDIIPMNICTYYLQFADLPRYLWYPVKNVEDLNRFINLYTESCINTKLPQKKHIRYDLKRNNNFHPIMLERYMVTNTFTDNFVWGPVVANDENIIDIVSSLSLFDMATKYYDMMQQYEDVFVLCTVSRYSRSEVTVQISITGTIADVYYIPESTYCEQIKQINTEIDSDFDEDLPIDIVLFLLPFAAVSQRYHVKSLDHNAENQIPVDDEMINMVYRLNVGIMNHKDLIVLMKRFYDKIEIGNKEKPAEHDIQGKYMIDIIKNYITREYIDMMTADSDAAKILDEKDKDIKSSKDDKNKKDRKYIKDKIKTDAEAVLSDDNEEIHATNMMTSVIKLMMDSGDKKFIDKRFLKKHFYRV